MRAAILFFALLCSHVIIYAQGQSTVVLVSFDGFRHDYVERYDAIHFKEFIRKGSAAKGLIPSFPSKTFPNHYSLVTGLYPGNHGLVDNNFYDPDTRVHYTSKNKKAVVDSLYYGGKPLWRLARESGLRSASYFWVGSEVTEYHPDYYYPYDDNVPDQERIEQVLQWLRLPEEERPRFIAVYFSITDDKGHQYGPESEQTRLAVLHADSILAQLMKGIEQVKLPINVVVVSDHGMKGIVQQESSYLLLPEIMPALSETTKVANSGSHVHLYETDTAKRRILYDALRSNARHFSVKLKEDFPEYWHFKSKRAGDILLLAEPGYYFLDMSRQKLTPFMKPWGWAGVHGYDPRGLTDMNGIFYAQGPNIRQGYTLEPFENIHVYPLIARILELPLPPIDGNIDVLGKLYQKSSRRKSSVR